MPKKVSDGTEHCAHVLFTELVVCKREGAVFYAGGRSKDYERCGAMTEEYARELHRKLGEEIASLDAERGLAMPAIDDISLAETEGLIEFDLKSGGVTVGKGRVTKTVGKKAKKFLDDLFRPDNVVRLKPKRAVELLLIGALTDTFFRGAAHAASLSALL